MPQAGAVKTTTVYRTRTVRPAEPSYDDVYNRCFQASEANVDEYYTYSDLGAYCRGLASSVGTE
jgi:hypothetical protein